MNTNDPAALKATAFQALIKWFQTHLQNFWKEYILSLLYMSFKNSPKL
jgi:hypothetical protein